MNNEFKKFYLKELSKLKININIKSNKLCIIYPFYDFQDYYEYILKKNISLLPQYKHIVFTPHKYCQKFRNLNIINLEINKWNVYSLNDIHFTFNKLSFWKSFSEEYILVNGNKSILFQSNIEEFFKYDYIGRVWFKPKNHNDIYLGDWSFSLRNKKIMLDILSKYKPSQIPEKLIPKKFMKKENLTNIPNDIFLSYFIISKKYKFPTYNKTNNFCLESNKVLDVLGTNNIFMNKHIYLRLIKKKYCKDNFRNYCLEIENLIPELPIIKQNKKLETVLIEFRELKHLQVLLKNTIFKLGNKWSHTIVCGINNYNFMKKIVKNINRDIKILKLDLYNVTIEEYNKLLLSKKFWELFKSERVLIYQEDTFIFTNNYEIYLKYDYIGAPWDCKNIGNGGFSLRNPKECILSLKDCEMKLNKYSIKNFKNLIKNNRKILGEDIYFSHYIKNKPHPFLAQNFSVETCDYPNPFGGHNFFLYLNDWKIKMKNSIQDFKNNHEFFRYSFYYKPWNKKRLFILERKNLRFIYNKKEPHIVENMRKNILPFEKFILKNKNILKNKDVLVINPMYDELIHLEKICKSICYYTLSDYDETYICLNNKFNDLFTTVKRINNLDTTKKFIIGNNLKKKDKIKYDLVLELDNKILKY